LIQRDGKMLDLEHDSYDRLTEVENDTTGETTQYIYDGAGNRVKALEGSQERRFLVAPAMGGGLESSDLITDGNGNLISNYIYGGGSSPFMRLDASGNAVYYLTDALGTVIGLADGSGASAGKFIYDAFGNVLSQVGGNNSAAGGDFRFQGQWLEEDTGLYNFRARDYDPATGLFLSRDPVDIIEMAPESFNPYQFVYNNPYIYSDPNGMFTINELQIRQVIDDILQTLQTQARSSAIDKAKGVVGNILNHFLGLVLPGDLEFIEDVINKIKPLPKGKQNAGDLLEDLVVDTALPIINYAFPSFSNIVWREPEILPDGTPVYNGKNYGQPKDPTSKKQSGQTSATKPDFVLSNYKPADEVRYNPLQKSWLIGDFKLSVSKAKEYLDKQKSQWNSMEGYAKHYQYAPLVSFITFYDNQAQIALMKKTAITRDNVFLFVIPITNTEK
jgi:RHS repeat-associated protein